MNISKTSDKSYQNGDPKEHFGAEWDLKNIKLIDQYDEIVASLQVTNKSDLTVRHYHSVFSHFPIDFNEKCEYRSGDKNWYDSNQNQNGLENQTKCVLTKVDMLLKKLKKIGAYENSIIVLKSDHGEPYNYFDNYPDNVMLNQANRFGYNRYRPFLMIKNTNINQDEIKFDDRHVLLNDLAITLCKASQVKGANCNQHGGIDLFTENQGLDEPYFLYLPKDRKSNFSYDTHMSIKVPNRRIELIDFLKNHPSVDVQECLKAEKTNSDKSQCRNRAKL